MIQSPQMFLSPQGVLLVNAPINQQYISLTTTQGQNFVVPVQVPNQSSITVCPTQIGIPAATINPVVQTNSQLSIALGSTSNTSIQGFNFNFSPQNTIQPTNISNYQNNSAPTSESKPSEPLDTEPPGEFILPDISSDEDGDPLIQPEVCYDNLEDKKINIIIKTEPHANDQTEENEQKEQACFECVVCAKTFNFRKCLSDHMASHRNNLTCNACYRSFTAKHQLLRHKEKGSCVYKCPTCEEPFRLKSYLSRHMLKHSRDKACKCMKCGKLFKDRATLNHHHCPSNS